MVGRGEDRGFDKKKGNEKQMTVQGRGCVFERERDWEGDRLWRRWWWWTSDGETKGKIMENQKEGGERERDRWKCKMAILQIHLRDNLRFLPPDRTSPPR